MNKSQSPSIMSTNLMCTEALCKLYIFMVFAPFKNKITFGVVVIPSINSQKCQSRSKFFFLISFNDSIVSSWQDKTDKKIKFVAILKRSNIEKSQFV